MTRAVDKPCFALQLRTHKGEKYGANHVCVLCVTLTISAEEQQSYSQTPLLICLAIVLGHM